MEADGHRLFPGVEGDYLVFCDRANHIVDAQGRTIANYATGKLQHIHKPIAIDADGKSVVCELLIDQKSNLLRITIPQDFLTSCKYPLRLDPTFGSPTSTPTSGSMAINGRIRGVGTTPASAGTANSISFFDNTGTWANTEHAQGAYYTGAMAGNGTLVAMTVEGHGNATAGWHALDFSGTPSVTNSVLHTACITSDGAVEGAYDAVSTEIYGGTKAYVVDGYPNPYTDTKGTYSFRYVVYCTYTEGAPAGVQPSRLQ
jgi:hypothetical protein